MVAIGFLALGGLLTGCPPAAGSTGGGTDVPRTEAGRVVRVIDGDTYDVLSGGRVLRVRLTGADAPEPGQPYGRQVADSVRRLLSPRQLVALTLHGQDLYGRTLATVVLPAAGKRPAVALDSLLVARGWAWAWAPRHKVPRLAAVQQQAQRQGRGLWHCPPAVPPSIWRNLSAAGKRRYASGCPR
ncbi:thermonuclease family protein [Hymenobacter aquaticus]|uniref:thermonuclease family protein n=1 Tax=Hymenobacter aquaticus TaxID=1867101 RepID=UPI001FD8CADB|nr:thermonuclease family protein [Hymenobacter aquaticus]